MKKIKGILLLIVSFITIFTTLFTNKAYAKAPNFTKEEQKWVKEHKAETFKVGIDPYSGTEYFIYDKVDKGYMQPLLKIISDDLGMNFKLKVYNNWSEVYSCLQNGTIDVLCGANKTPERNKIMSFTEPILSVPYGIISKKSGNIHTIGDLDGKRVGFLKDDFVSTSLPKLYKHINYNESFYSSHEKGITALRNNKIDAFITSGGPAIYDYIYKYPDLSITSKINTINSDMTFSALKENKILINILNKEINYLRSKNLPELINSAEINYNIKIMGLTKEEETWLKEDGTAVVGIAKNYLPFDYYENGKYKGIDAEILEKISKMTGIKLKYKYDDFDVLADKLKAGTVNILNIAKTDDRTNIILYPPPFSTERDIIIGRKESKEVHDIFGLEGKRVAVIKGFWHKEVLNKNLTKVKIIDTVNIEESMKLVMEGKADYLIENPTVARYYITDLLYYDLVQRGETSSDSFLYFGISKNKPELSSIIIKIMPMLDFAELSTKGYDEVPHTPHNESYKKLVFTTISLGVILVFVVFFLIRLFKALLNEKTEKKLLEQREYLLSLDNLTEIHNRNYLMSKVLVNLNNEPFPQVLIVCDMNNLKYINDNYGHQTGDTILKLFADSLKEVFKKDDQLFRLGGDEFLILLTGVSKEEAIELIKKAKAICFEKTLILNDGTDFRLSASFGYSIRKSTLISYDELFKRADNAMYEEKKYKVKL